jgi:hypothetical protein
VPIIVEPKYGRQEGEWVLLYAILGGALVVLLGVWFVGTKLQGTQQAGADGEATESTDEAGYEAWLRSTENAFAMAHAVKFRPKHERFARRAIKQGYYELDEATSSLHRAPGAEPPEVASHFDSARQEFARVTIPTLAVNDPAAFMDAMSGDDASELVNAIIAEASPDGAKPDLEPGMVAVHVGQVGEDETFPCAVLTMPEPEHSGEAYFIGVVHRAKQVEDEAVALDPEVLVYVMERSDGDSAVFVRREPDHAPMVLGQTEEHDAPVFLASITNQLETLEQARA